MTKSRAIYLYSQEERSGMRMVAMGIMEMLKTRVQDVAYFKPVIETTAQKDDDIDFFKRYFQLKQPRNSAYGITLKQLKHYVLADQVNTAYEQILERFSLLEKKYDFIVCEGVGRSGVEVAGDNNIDFEIAENLSASLAYILNVKGIKDTKEIRISVDTVLNLLKKKKVSLLGLFINRVGRSLFEEVRNRVKSDVPLFILPEVRELDCATILEICDQIGAKLLTDDAAMLDRSVFQSKVAAMMPQHYLKYLEEGDLIIVPGDRHDIAVTTFLANLSKNYPAISGILFTGGMELPESIGSLIDGADLPVLPMMVVDTHTQSATLNVQNVVPKITLKSKRKLSLAVGVFNRYVDVKLFGRSLSLTPAKRMTPVRFIYMLYEKSRKTKKNILLPESEDARVLRAAEIVLRRGLCRITLLGEPKKVKQRAAILGLDLTSANIVDPKTFPNKEEFARKFYELRKHKGVILPMAREYMSRINYFATMMLYEGYVDGIVSGATHTTRETIKPAFEIIKMQEGVGLISSLFFMLLEDKVLVYADCAVNPDPNAHELAQIAICSAQSAKSFGIKPKVAMLSYSSGNSGVGTDVQKVKEATKIAQKLAPDILIEGPMQYDAAIDPKVAAAKMPESKVAGEATVFIFPDLNTGNNTYKAVQRSADAVAIGPILQGLKKPVNDLSRGCMVEDIVYTVAITAIQAAKIIS